MIAAWRRFGAFAFLFATSASQPVADWSTADMTPYGGPARFAQSRAICARVINAEPPAGDLPSPAEREALRGCNSRTLYYGIGMPADPRKARLCAAIEREQGMDEPLPLFSREGMLMMIYANGRGAARNLDVAIHMACQLQDAPAAMESRIARLDGLRRGRWRGQDFQSCDDISSGMSGGLCADHAADLAEQDRGRRIARLESRWTSEQRAAFQRVYARFGDYAGTAHEMDCFRGTAQAQCRIDGQQADLEAFLLRLEALAAGRSLSRRARSAEGLNAATDHAAWQAFTDGLEPETRAWYRSNGQETRDARARFERELIAFAAIAMPRLSAHQVRAIFSDL